MSGEHRVNASVRLRAAELKVVDINRRLGQYRGCELDIHQAAEVRRLEILRDEAREEVEKLTRELQALYH